MISKINTAVLFGIDGICIEVETDIARGIPSFQIVGLAGTSVKEAKERVRSAIKNSGFDFPISRITANLVPANIKKEGSHLDLPIAIGILESTGIIKEKTNEYSFIGELSLSGEITRVEGALPLVLALKEKGIEKLIIPYENRIEIGILIDSDIEIYPVRTLKEIVDFINGDHKVEQFVMGDYEKIQNSFSIDFSQIKGQEIAKRAMEIAATGMHNIILNGPAGSGKTMLASRIPTILPELSYEEIIEVTKIYSIAGLLKDEPVISSRPFRSPHHTSTRIAIVGGGINPMPGEVSLASKGVLFLDEFPEFNKQVIESLRQPIEDGKINISRQGISVEFPSDFMLIATMNPCPCGNYGTDKECSCTASEMNRYKRKLSSPILDRIDLQIYVNKLKLSDLKSKTKPESSKEIRKRIKMAHRIQKQRLGEYGLSFNSQMNSEQISRYCVLDRESDQILDEAYHRLGLSARSYNKILKLSRTIADLDKSQEIKKEHIYEALQYRMSESF